MRRIFDQRLIVQRRRRAIAAAQAGADFLLARVVDDLLDRLAAVKRRFTIAVDLATPTPLLADALAASGLAGTVVRLDRLAGGEREPRLRVAADPEALPLADAGVHLVVSALGLHTIDDLPGVFAQVRRALRSDGLFLAAIPAGDTLAELREALAAAEAEARGGASPRVAPFAGLRDLAGLLQRAGFALPVADTDRLTVRYADAFALMRDLRAMGATNALRDRDRRPLTRSILARAADIYAARSADPDGRVRATFEIVSLSGWAPDASQPQPLRPGSAKMRLADALGVAERPAGEKAGR